MTVKLNIKLKPLLLNIAVPLAVGGLSALITGGGFREYKDVNQPPFSPPAWLFPVVWTALYILMGVSSYLICEKISEERNRPLTVYAVQLFLNFLWPIFFFSLKAYLFSLIWLLLLWAFITAMIILFSRVNKTAGFIQIPYLIWVTFAAYLNFGVFWMN